MGVYLGYIRKVDTRFKFKPLAKVKDSKLIVMSSADRKNLLPASEDESIWFYYSDNPKRNITNFLADKTLVIFEFKKSDIRIIDNYPRKNVESSGYRVNFMKFIDNGKIRRIREENIFYAQTVSDKSNGTIYELADGDFHAKVFIPNTDTKGEVDSMTKAEYEARIAGLEKELERLTANLKAAEEQQKAMVTLKSASKSDYEAKIAKLGAALAEATDKIAKYEKVENLKGEIYYLQRRISDLKAQCEKFEHDKREAESQFDSIFRNAKNRIADIAFSGVMANKLLDAAANFDAKDLDAQDKALAENIAAIKPAEKSPADLNDYLCYMIGLARPSYGEADILNIAICLTQNFLTVFYGEPGCGKTSICNLFAEALGLNKIAAAVEDTRASRYIPISVEKGWTSKRDFVGYYNPLSKTFDKSNRRIYDALRLLHAENKNSALPFVFLLDEANLSPMEYYWSDFMNLCDELDENSSVNLGADYIFSVPETLRFVATINNDHTTEELSPRLIDRACIITLPDFDAKNLQPAAKIPASEVEIISWKSLRDAFNPPNPYASNFPANTYSALVDKMKAAGFSVSPRAHKAVYSYYAAAEKFLGKATAFDYAVAQKILPKIHGSDESFKAWLTSLQKLFADNKLPKSAGIVQKILARGDKNLGYYRFFA